MKKMCIIIYCLICVFFVNAQNNFYEKKSTNGQIAARELKARKTFQTLLRTGNSMASDNFNITYYRCEWNVDPAVRFIRGVVTSYFTTTVATNTITFDMHAALKVDSVLFKGHLIEFQHTAEHALTVRFAQMLSLNQADSVSVFYEGVPAGEGFGSFVVSTQNGSPVTWTLSEPYGAKDWWPCKNGPSDKADSIDIVITYPDKYTSSSNGLLIRQVKQNGKLTDYWKHRYPIASYLVAFALTNFEIDRDSARIGENFLPVNMYAYPVNFEYFKKATSVAKACLEKFSSLFGAYPFIKESYSQTQFGFGGGMEHQTNSFLLNNQDQLVAHELAHQWFGDKVTCNSWEDIWLNEGFAQYAQFIYVENFEPGQVLTHLDQNRKLVTSMPDGSVKVNDTTSIDRIFDSRLSYAKGACVLHMIRWRLGDSLFFKGLRQYLDDPVISYGTAHTADLLRNLETVSGQDFKEFFNNWYEGEGFPSYQVQWAANRNNWIRIRLSQTCSHRSVTFYAMPVPVLLKSNSGKDTIVVFNHTKNGEEFWVNPGFKVDSVIFDPELRLLSDKNTITKIEEGNSLINEIRIFPNPSKGILYIQIKNPTGSKLQIHVLNAASQLLFRQDWPLTGRDELIDIPSTNWPMGIYWVHIKGDGFNFVKKILN